MVALSPATIITNLFLSGVIVPVIYLLKDQFTTTLAAGSVNGTAAEPGPGTRTVVDTQSKLSIASGHIAISGGKATPAYGDPLLYYASQARAAGRALMADVTPYTAGDDGAFVGWHLGSSFTSGASIKGVIYFQNGGTILSYNGSAAPTIGAWVTATAYAVAIIIKSTGYYILVKGGIYTNYTLLWMDTTITTDPVTPVCDVYSIQIDLDNFRIPDSLYLPPCAAYDTFTRANGALGTSETAGPDGQAVTGRAWTDQIGTWEIASNKADPSALSGAIGIATVNAGVADVLVDAAITQTLLKSGIVVRYVDSSNYIAAYYDGTNAKLDKVVAGSTTSVISAAKTYAAGAVLRVICQGTSFSLFYNGAQVGSTSTISDAGLQSGTLHGLYSTGLGNTMDNFLVLSRGVDNAYTGLDGY